MHDRIDLHTHSNCSDGVLSPVELVALAATRSVQLLALTDHDTVAGCDAARKACATHGIAFVDGVELTATWRDREIHVVGLRIDPRHPALVTHMDELERVLKKGGAVGKRLDFLMQELNREANTLSSKSVSGEVTAIALELKLLIEQKREQVQNLE